jgi:RHS repeat-associated protein
MAAINRLYTNPYGATRGESNANSIPGDTQFLGKTRDEASGLSLFGARYYDEAAGTFVSVDPFLDHEKPQQWNAYGYSENNPLTWADPTGLYASHCATMSCAHATGGVKSPTPPRPKNQPVIDNFVDGREKSISAWELGGEWITGSGINRTFGPDDDFTKMVRKSEHYQSVRQDLTWKQHNQVLSLGWKPAEGLYDRRLNGIDQLGTFVGDGLTILTFGANGGNGPETFLGSHKVSVEVVAIYPNGDSEVEITATNSTTLQSATRPPVIGYEPWFEPINDMKDAFAQSTGFGRTTLQTVVWTERISGIKIGPQK